MSGTLSPVAIQQEIDGDGVPMVSAKLYTYEAGSSTPATTYFNADLAPAHANTNPVVTDADGRFPAIYLEATSYKFILKDSAGVTIWTQDDITSVGLTTDAAVTIYPFFGDPTSPITATSYPVGDTFDKCHAGTSFWALDSNDLAAGTYELQGMLMNPSGATVSAELVNRTDDAETALVTISGTSTTGTGARSTAITFAVGGVTKSYAIKTKVSSGSGYVWGLQIMRVA